MLAWAFAFGAPRTLEMKDVRAETMSRETEKFALASARTPRKNFRLRRAKACDVEITKSYKKVCHLFGF